MFDATKFVGASLQETDDRLGASKQIPLPCDKPPSS